MKMLKIQSVVLYVLFTFLLTLNTAGAQTITQFPIAIGSDSTFMSSMAFDGENYLVPLVGDDSGANDLNFQFVSKSGSLVGQRVSLGTEARRGALAAFDGTNYLLCWNDLNDKLWGRFIAPTGTAAGDAFVISPYGWIGNNSLIFAGGSYAVIYEDTLSSPNHRQFIYGRFISPGGSVGNPIQISQSEGNLDGSLDFDGSNYLAVWRGTGDYSYMIYGQFISSSGTLVGNNFSIDDSQYKSDNPVDVAFDGTRYLVCFEDEVDANNDIWHLYGRFVSPSGDVQERIPIAENGNNLFGFLAFDGEHYLVTYHHFVNVMNNEVYLIGRYFDTTGQPSGDTFIIFSPVGGKVPIGGVQLFDGTDFLTGVNLVKINISPEGDVQFSDGDVYGVLLSEASNEVSDGQGSGIPAAFSLDQNYPNPFNPVTTIEYAVPESESVILSIYDVTGKELKRSILGMSAAGTHTIQWDGRNQAGERVASGMYFYRIEAKTKAGTLSGVKRMILLK